MTIESHFTKMDRNYEIVWLHKTKPTWVTFYENSTHPVLSFYQAYKAIEKIPDGRLPWTVDHCRMGPLNNGFRTLEEAMTAADGFAPWP